VIKQRRRHVPPKRRSIFKGLYGVITQEIALYISSPILSVYGSFNDVLSSSGYRTSNVRIVNNELERIWKEVFWHNFEELSFHLPGGTKERSKLDPLVTRKHKCYPLPGTAVHYGVLSDLNASEYIPEAY
jgi:hypothetical protein